MAYTFSTTVSRGEAKGEPMEPWKDDDGNYELFDPAKRRDGSVLRDNCFRTRSLAVARKLVEERGYSIRMRIRGATGGPGSMIKANRIVVIDISSDK